MEAKNGGWKRDKEGWLKKSLIRQWTPTMDPLLYKILQWNLALTIRVSFLFSFMFYTPTIDPSLYNIFALKHGAGYHSFFLFLFCFLSFDVIVGGYKVVIMKKMLAT